MKRTLIVALFASISVSTNAQAKHSGHHHHHDAMPMPGVVVSKPVPLTVNPFAPQPVTPAPTFPPGYNPFAPTPVAPTTPLTAAQIAEVAFMVTPAIVSVPTNSNIAIVGPGGVVSYVSPKTPLAPPPGMGAQFAPVSNPSSTQAGAVATTPVTPKSPALPAMTGGPSLFSALFGN